MVKKTKKIDKVKNSATHKIKRNMQKVSFMSWQSKVETFLRFLKHFGVFFLANKGKSILLNQVEHISQENDGNL